MLASTPCWEQILRFLLIRNIRIVHYTTHNVHLFYYACIVNYVRCIMRYARSILHECVLFHTLLDTLSQISFAFKNDTPQGHDTNCLFLYYACMHTCTFGDACVQNFYLCINRWTEAYKVHQKWIILYKIDYIKCT